LTLPNQNETNKNQLKEGGSAAGTEISADMEYQQMGYQGFRHINIESITNKNAGLSVWIR
jgi:hypothetical protein